VDWIGAVLVVSVWVAMVSTCLYGFAGGFRAWGRSLWGRLFLGALSGPVVGALLGALGGALSQSNPWAPAHQKLGVGESVCVGLLTGGTLLGVPAAILGALIGLIMYHANKER
jgi:hypothetical protein